MSELAVPDAPPRFVSDLLNAFFDEVRGSNASSLSRASTELARVVRGCCSSSPTTTAVVVVVDLRVDSVVALLLVTRLRELSKPEEGRSKRTPGLCTDAETIRFSESVDDVGEKLLLCASVASGDKTMRFGEETGKRVGDLERCRRARRRSFSSNDCSSILANNARVCRNRCV
jgi:hypothetical protein